MRLHSLLVEIDLHLQYLSAIGGQHSGTGDSRGSSRMKFCPRSNNCICGSFLLDNASCRIGTLEAL